MFKPNQIIVRPGEERRVLQVLGGGQDQIVFLEVEAGYAGLCGIQLAVASSLEEAGWHVEENQDEWPRIGERYWFINSDGYVGRRNWSNDVVDNNRRSFLGIYRTEEEAISARDKIKKALGK